MDSEGLKAAGSFGFGPVEAAARPEVDASWRRPHGTVQRARGLAWRVLLAAFAATLAHRQPACAMDFHLSGQTVYGSGEIVPGDAGRFLHFAAESHVEAGMNGDAVLELSGAGGDPAEAVFLGEALRKTEMPARVGRGKVCASACALAFLGGTRAYATGTGPGRILEFGGKLSFRGLLSPAGEAGSRQSRLALDTLLAYAREMRGIDVGLLVELASSAPSSSAFADTPRQIEGLRIELAGIPKSTPSDWFVHACRRVVARHLPPLQDAGGRVAAQGDPIPTVKALRQAIIAGRADEPAVARALNSLGDADALDLAVGGSLYLESRKPILDARSVRLDRGAGLYFDACIAVRSKEMVSAVLLDGVGHEAALESFSGGRDFLAMFGLDASLW